jgi:cytochrome c biogenesis protein CcmG/thiol:disulfide interchange protein DsbE
VSGAPEDRGAKRSLLKWPILFALLGAVAFLPHCEKKMKGSDVAPNFSLKTLQGQEMDLASLRGKVVLIDFWATWCAPCRESIPHLADLYKRHRENGFEVIGISVDKGDAEVVRRFSRSVDIPYPVLMASEEVTRNYGVTALPTTFLIDPEGKIHGKMIGFNAKIAKELAAQVKELLSGRP